MDVRIGARGLTKRYGSTVAVDGLSHELRTPLFGIKGFTELYRMGGLPTRDDVDRTMIHIERESARLASLAEDLLLLATVDEQPDVLALTPMDLRTVAAGLRADLRALDPSRPVEVTGPDGHGPPGRAPVLGDEARLRRVATNLVGNVIAHTPPGTPVRVGVGTVEGGAGAHDRPVPGAAHRRRVDLRTAPGEGATFRAVLPEASP